MWCKTSIYNCCLLCKNYRGTKFNQPSQISHTYCLPNKSPILILLIFFLLLQCLSNQKFWLTNVTYNWRMLLRSFNLGCPQGRRKLLDHSINKTYFSELDETIGLESVQNAQNANMSFILARFSNYNSPRQQKSICWINFFLNFNDRNRFELLWI